MRSGLRHRIVPYLWYANEAEEAARFYTSIFPDSRVESVWSLQAESHSGPPGTVKVVDFTLFGQAFRAMSAGPMETFNHAISLMVDCEDQAEVDRYWNALLDGGTPEPCGWLKDKFGVSWQITPIRLMEMMADPDPAKARRVAEAMLRMGKLELPVLEAAYRGS
jgi:predicted 3-demethylubiquinone-9 3-methyltransferase (glyoxalase superfamily)